LYVNEGVSKNKQASTKTVVVIEEEEEEVRTSCESLSNTPFVHQEQVLAHKVESTHNTTKTW
jgi:hypothetical protein